MSAAVSPSPKVAPDSRSSMEEGQAAIEAGNARRAEARKGTAARPRRLSNFEAWQIEPPGLKRSLKRIINNPAFSVFMMIVTFYALFGDDARATYAAKEDDVIFHVLAGVAMVFFLFEFGASCMVHPGYIGSFFFYLDFIATASLIMDLGITSSPDIEEEAAEDSVDASAVRAGRASRAGTRAGRIVRIVRIVRLIRVVKLFKHLQGRAEIIAARVETIIEALALNLNVEELHDIFVRMDKDGNEMLDESEVRAMLKQMDKTQQAFPQQGVRMFMSRMDMTKEGTITWEGFRSSFEAIKYELQEKAAYAELNSGEHQSGLGTKLSDMSMRRVIMLVLILLLMQPFLGVTPEPDTASFYGLQLIHDDIQALRADPNCTTIATCNAVLRADAGIRKQVLEYAALTHPLHLRIRGPIDDEAAKEFSSKAVIEEWLQEIPDYGSATNAANDPGNPNPCKPIYGENRCWYFGRDYYPHVTTSAGSDLNTFFRPVEVSQTVYPLTDNAVRSLGYFNNRDFTQMDSLSAMYQTVCLLIILMVIAQMITNDVSKLVVKPIERMVAYVGRLAVNPLAKAPKKQEPQKANKGLLTLCNSADDDTDNYELALVENTLGKIAGLVQIGLGEAGAEIISSNMDEGDFNPMIPGKRIYGAFGFCDIRRFTDATECLKEEVMVFVNRIGKIVHGAADLFSGFANKNIGDAFLMVWKVPKDALGDACVAKIDEHLPPVHLRSAGQRADAGDDEGAGPQLGASATASSLGLSTSGRKKDKTADNALLSFLRTMVELKKSLELKRYANDKRLAVRFTMPYEVKMGYGLHMGYAIEGAIGSTFKIDASYLAPDVNMSSRLEAATKQFRTPILMSHWFWGLLSRDLRERCRNIDCVTVKGSAQPMSLYTFDVTNESTTESIEFNSQCAKLQEGLPTDFLPKFQEGVDAYLQGRWQQAREKLEEGLEIKNGDGPTQTLMEVMEESNFKAPDDWPGYRELTEK